MTVSPNIQFSFCYLLRQYFETSLSNKYERDQCQIKSSMTISIFIHIEQESFVELVDYNNLSLFIFPIEFDIVGTSTQK